MKLNLSNIIDVISTEIVFQDVVEAVIIATEKAQKAHLLKEPDYYSSRYDSWINKDEMMIRILGNMDNGCFCWGCGDRMD
jgi:hypothetical protein